jgi:hypothetical protein
MAGQPPVSSVVTGQAEVGSVVTGQAEVMVKVNETSDWNTTRSWAIYR